MNQMTPVLKHLFNFIVSTRLICFHHAGGSTNQYLNLLKPWKDQLEIWVLDLPARAFRSKEPAITKMDDLITLLINQLADLPPKPTRLFGHSMGALIAYELSCHCKKQANPIEIQKLGISGLAAPSNENLRNKKIISELPEDEFLSEIEKYSPMPDMVKKENSSLKFFLEVARNDMKLIESYKNSNTDILNIPSYIFSGSEDLQVPVESLTQWQKLITLAHPPYIYAGGHFYLFSHLSEVFNIMTA